MALITNEIPTGVINSVNTIFTTTQNIYEIDDLIIDGAFYTGATTIAGNQITLADAPTATISVDYFTAAPTVPNTNTTFSNLLVKLASKLANRSTKFYTNADRADALNWARTQMSYFNFPELIFVVPLVFSPTTLNGVDCAVAVEPDTLNRYVKIWDINSKVEFAYIQPTLFDQGTNANCFTREFNGGQRLIYVLPSTTTSLYARYAKAITLFSTDGSVVNEFDSHYDDLIIDGAINWLSLKGRDFNDLAVFGQSFKSQIAQVFQNNVEQGGTPEHPRFIFYGEKFNILQP